MFCTYTRNLSFPISQLVHKLLSMFKIASPKILFVFTIIIQNQISKYRRPTIYLILYLKSAYIMYKINSMLINKNTSKLNKNTFCVLRHVIRVIFAYWISHRLKWKDSEIILSHLLVRETRNICEI